MPARLVLLAACLPALAAAPGLAQRPDSTTTLLGPQEVQAIEVYRSNSETPAEFLDGSGCGVLAIWTKRGP